MAAQRRVRRQRSPTPVEPQYSDSSSTIPERSISKPQSTLPLLTYYAGTRTSRGNMVFRQRPQPTTREQEEQPLTLEARLSRIEARLGTMETQVSTILDILQSCHSQHQQPR
ncbi:hypothetical protein J1N35_002406 [Gossypium stocksii]|uniref:Uncharacterized protein n=1 Tax=Gossypium stocksii TaxID=47602 RepID=A0A9D4ANG5_9ROSI|nr:hypothetical protein J1N35_002406 [Gossypium stocksii]